MVLNTEVVAQRCFVKKKKIVPTNFGKTRARIHKNKPVLEPRFFHKVVDLKPTTLLNTRRWHRYFLRKL